MATIVTNPNYIQVDGARIQKGTRDIIPLENGVRLQNTGSGSVVDILVDGTTIDGQAVADRTELLEYLDSQGFKSGGSGPGTEASWGSITGDIEDQADLVNYIAAEGAFNVEDVTQVAYIDKAINVKAFNNTGMSYSEGSIDFGITRNSTHTMGLYAFKQGFDTTASGTTSSAFGYQTQALGDSSTAFGNSTIASGDYSFAFGSYTQASGIASTAFGVYTTANEYASLAIGQNSTDGPVETEWTQGSPIFKVGNGTDTENRSNAYVLYNDGRSEQIKDVEVTEIGQGVVIKSPDGTRWRITVDNNGDLTTAPL